MCRNNYLGSHFCKSVPTMISFPLLQQCVPTMIPGHAGCLVPKKNATDRHTWTNPVRCSSLTLQRKKRQKSGSIAVSFLRQPLGSNPSQYMNHFLWRCHRSITKLRFAKQFDNFSSAGFDMTGLYRSGKFPEVVRRLLYNVVSSVGKHGLRSSYIAKIRTAEYRMLQPTSLSLFVSCTDHYQFRPWNFTFDILRGIFCALKPNCPSIVRPKFPNFR
jgi:hypothetical protein